MKKLFRITTVPKSINGLLKNQLRFLNDYFEVTAVSSPGFELAEIRKREGVKTIALKMERKISIFNDLIALYRMWRLFMKEKPFIIHSHTDKAGLLAMIAGKFAGVPHRIHTYAGLIFPTSTGIKRYILWTTDWLTCYFSTISIPEGTGVRNELLKNKITIRPLNIIANGSLCGIDVEYYTKTDEIISEAKQIRNSYNILENEIVFSFIGRIVKDKGIEELILAFVNLIENQKIQARLLIAGDFDDNLDPVNSDIEKCIKNHPRIHWLGFTKDVRPVFVASDVFVLPSYREGFPNVVIQACALEVPTIVTNIIGSNDIIQHKINGLVIASKNISALQNAMSILYYDYDLRIKIGTNARENVIKKYNQKIIWDELKKLYCNLN